MSPTDGLLLHSDLQRHTQGSTQDTSSYFTHMCIQKADLSFNILQSQGFVDFF